MKWSFVPKDTSKPKYILANADESEPGTCKDRPLMEMDPHQLIEGMVIAGRAVAAEKGSIYIRGEYRYLIDIVDRAISEAYAKGYLGKNILGSGFNFDIAGHTGAGAYECGEESALMESLEGKRGYPRIKPPFPAVVGLLAARRLSTTWRRSAPFRRSFASGAATGTQGWARSEKRRYAPLFDLRSRQSPGIYELPLGFPLRRLIERRCGRHAKWQEN